MKLSILIPALDDRELLKESLPLVLTEAAVMGEEWELLVIDDTGAGALRDWLQAEFPLARCVERAVNGGFAAATLTGAEEAKGEVLCVLNPDVCIRPGFFEPLLERLEGSDVFAVAPLVLRDGEQTDESLPELVQEDGAVVIRRAAVVEPGAVAPGYEEGYPVAFALGGAFLVRRDEFMAQAGFDSLFEPFYFEDVDLCWSAWRSGRRVVVDPRAVAEHSNRGTIGAHVPKRLVRASIEKNRHLFAWKHLDGEALEAYLDGLGEELADAVASEDRERITWLTLALDQLPESLKARRRAQALPRDHSATVSTLIKSNSIRR
ncbi:MAG: glycosyltransferase [Planctomycetes bacterium]|nr:glycosyltransferase [Planctomycetota bacterium]